MADILRNGPFHLAVAAMVIVGFAYSSSITCCTGLRRIYAIVSFPIVVISYLFLCRLLPDVLGRIRAINLADDPTIKHAIYIVLALIIAVFAWRKRQNGPVRTPTNTCSPMAM